MRCRICNTIMESVTINPDTGEIEICTDCETSVKEALDEFEPVRKGVDKSPAVSVRTLE
jgi:ribosome-binding protein aMBF1 (putative translation factor)